MTQITTHVLVEWDIKIVRESDQSNLNNSFWLPIWSRALNLRKLYMKKISSFNNI